MKTKCLIVLLAAFVVGFATFSYAQGRDKGRNAHESQGIQGIDQRLRNAHAGIDRGIQSGALTRDEANRLKSELNRVRDDEARMKADGRLTHPERQRLEKELNRLEKHISQLKHNVNRRDKGRNAHESQGIQGIDQRLRNAHAGIDRGIQSGALTRDEANRLKSELNRVRDDEARMKADGRLTHPERQRLEKELNRLEKHISQLKHNVNRRDQDRRR